MRILITNDDGIHAPGLKALERIARALSDDLWIVAPETDQSGVAHSLTLTEPLRLREISERHFAVKGTPTDCVIMAVKHLMQELGPDLVLSGVNRGYNVADDVTYSGTVAGAIEGTLLGVRSIALSQGYSAATRHAARYETAEAHGPDLIRKLLAADLPQSTLVNINFPDLDAAAVRGARVTRQGKRNQASLEVDRRVDGRGFPYFWLAYRGRSTETGAGTDLEALRDGFISVTPLQLDLTDREASPLIEAALG